MIRAATLDDLPELLRMGRAFFEATAFAPVGYDEASVHSTLTMLIENPLAILLLAEQDGPCGCAAALVYPFYFNHGHQTAQELFWWVDPRARHSGIGAALLASLEGAAAARGAQSMTMIALAEIDGPRVAELYRRHGYAPSEQNFMRML